MFIMITNYVSKREISLKKGGVQSASWEAPQLHTKNHHSHRLGACQCRVPSVSCSPMAL